MFQMTTYLTTLLMTIILMQMTHPLAMGFILLIQSLLICIITGLMFNSFWFSYILFLIFLGGILILFIYVTTLASNEMFSFSMKMFTNYFMLMLCLMTLMLIIDKSLIKMIFNNDNMNNMFNMNYLFFNKMNLIKLYNYPTNMISIMLMNYLLLTLIMVTKITNISFGPLRMMN